MQFSPGLQNKLNTRKDRYAHHSHTEDFINQTGGFSLSLRDKQRQGQLETERDFTLTETSDNPIRTVFPFSI